MGNPEHAKKEFASFTTNKYLIGARYFDFRYGISNALGLGTLQRHDREGVRLFLASNELRESIRERRYELTNPVAAILLFREGENTDALQRKLDARQHARAQIDDRIERYMASYPQDPNRPHIIRQAVNDLITQGWLNSQQGKLPESPFFWELGKEWRKKLGPQLAAE